MRTQAFILLAVLSVAAMINNSQAVLPFFDFFGPVESFFEKTKDAYDPEFQSRLVYGIANIAVSFGVSVKKGALLLDENIKTAGELVVFRINGFEEKTPERGDKKTNVSFSDVESSGGDGGEAEKPASGGLQDRLFPDIKGFCRGLSSITAKAFLLGNVSRNTTLAARSSNDRWAIASLTKLMTSIVALETMSPGEKVKITKKAEATEGNIGNLKEGEIFRLDDLIHAMLIASSNRAAQAVAEAEDEAAFIDAMQAKAYELGMNETTFNEPTGLSFLNQSTAGDLYKLVLYIIGRHPDLLSISNEPEAKLTELQTGSIRKMPTVDRFSGTTDFIGGKTGYTDEARRNFVGLFKMGDSTVAAIVLGSDDAFKATKELLECYK